MEGPCSLGSVFFIKNADRPELHSCHSAADPLGFFGSFGLSDCFHLFSLFFFQGIVWFIVTDLQLEPIVEKKIKNSGKLISTRFQLYT